MIRSVAITGATGFIGRQVAADLAARGVAVTSIVRPGSRRQAPQDSTVVRAPLETAALVEAFTGRDAVIHLAGLVASVNARTYFTVNNADETARDAVDLGAGLCVALRDIPGIGRFCGITSPQGVTFYVIKYTH